MPTRPIARRRLAAALVLAPVAAALGPFAARAQQPAGTLPRSLVLLVPQAAGGSNDVFARAVAARLPGALGGGSAIVDNRPGANGNVGSTWLARSGPRDGSTWLVTVNSAQTINPVVYRNPGFDPLGDFEPVSGIAIVPHVVLVNPSFPARTFAEFVDVVKRTPGRFSYGSAGNGGFAHLLSEMMKRAHGLDIQHVPYKGVAPALTDLLGDSVQMVIATVPAALPYVKDGRLRPLAVPSDRRTPVLPDVPVASEVVPGMVGDLWIGMFAPKGVPAPMVAEMRAAVAKVLGSPDMEQFAVSQGAATMNVGPSELGAITRAELERWRPIVKAASLTID
jgi:tripartite-type tricarboxylate transporter receptor subunit TctC